MINPLSDNNDYRSPVEQNGISRSEIDFRKPQMIEDDFSLLGVGEKFMSGIFQGFTTINLSQREPDNVAEGIANSLGTWLGITGMFFTGPASISARFMAQGASRGARMATSMARSNFKSVPMWVGDKAVQGIKHLGKNLNTPPMRQFVQRHRLGMDAMEGATRIGTAMGVMGWQEGTDAMLYGGAMGAFFGGSDRLIGNAVRGMRPQLQAALKSSDPARIKKAERVMSMVSAGIVSGMPSTVMGQPWEYQIYDYLFGAWLGAEPSYSMRTAHSLVGKMRAKGKENELIHSKLREQDPDYREVIDYHKNPKVKQEIEEEVQAQVDFVLGQKINNSSKAPVIAALAHSASEAGNITAEKAVELNQAIFYETMQGQFLMEGIAKYKSQGEEQGMTDQAAEAFAMDRIRDEYAEWQLGRGTSESMQRLADSIDVYAPNKKDYELYKPVFVGDEVGIISQMDGDGNVLKVLASDGVELVRPAGEGKSEVVSREDKLTARANQSDVLPMTKKDFIDKIVGWRYATDDNDTFVNQGPDPSGAEIPQRMWDLFPEIASQYQQPSFFIDSDGGIYPEVVVGGKSLRRLDLKFDNEKDAYKYAMDYLAESDMQRSLNRNPADLHDSVILSRLAEAYNDMDYDARSRPIFDTVRDIIKDLDGKGELLDRSDIYSSPHKLYSKIHDILVANRDYNNQRMELTKELEKAKRDESPQREDRIAQAEKALDDLTNNFGRPLGWDGFLQQMKEQFPMQKKWFEQVRNSDTGKLEYQERTGDYWNQTNNSVIRDLRKWHKTVTHNERVNSLAIFRTPADKYMDQPASMRLSKVDVFPNNQRNISYRAPSMLQKALRSINQHYDTIHIDKVFNEASNQTEALNNIDGLSRDELNRMLDSMYDNGDLPMRYFVASGVKDKDSLRAIPYIFTDAGSANKFLDRRLNRLEKSQPEFVRSVKEKLSKASDDDTMQYASTMRLWEKLNNDSVGNRKAKGGKNKYKYPVEFLSNQSGFINTVAAMNKRLQIIDAEGMVADPSFYKNKDGSRKTAFRSVIVNLQNESSRYKNQAKGIDEFTVRGDNGDFLADQHRDGAVIVNQRTFDQMKADGGLDPQSGAIKGVTAYSDGDGAFLGKYAMFRADDSAQRFMEENNIDFLHNDSTAKQLGDRQTYDMQVDANGNTQLIKNSRPVKNPQIYDVPIEGVTINSGQSESMKSAFKRQGLPVQMLQTFSPHIMDASIATNTINEIISAGNRTTDEVNQFIAEVEAMDLARFDEGVTKKALADLREKAKSVNIYDMSTQDIFKVLGGDQIYEQSGLYDSVIRQMHKVKDDLLAESARDGDIESSLEIMNSEFSSQLDILMEVTADSGQLLTQRMLEQRGLKSYADAVYRNFIVSKTMRPKMDYSLKSIGSQQDPWFLQKYGKVEEGEFMMGQGAKNMKVRVGERDMRLGKAWEDSRSVVEDLAQIRSEMASIEKAISRFKGKEGKAQADLQRSYDRLQQQEIQKTKYQRELTSAMDMIVSRVPIEHASGVRSLTFKGFTDESGVTSKLNPRDMANLGGMDLDIDSVFIFQNIGKTKYEASDGTMRSAHDELKSSKVKDYWYNEDGTFRDPKSEEMQDQWQAVYDKSRNLADMFSPEKLFEAGRATAQANSSLGQVVNARRDLLAALERFPSEKFTMDDLNLSENQRKKLLEIYDDNTVFEFRKTDNALSKIDEIARAGINMSADAADLTSFIGKFDIKPMMHSEAYSLVAKTRKDIKDGMEANKIIAESILRSNSPLMKAMQTANQATNGKIGNQTNVDAFAMVTHLRTINSQVKDIANRSGIKGEPGLGDLHGSYYRSLRDMMDTPMYYKPMNDIDMQRLDSFYATADKFLNSGTKLTKMFKKGLEDITGRARGFYPQAYKTYVKEYNKVVKDYHNGEATLIQLQRAYKDLNEMIANDFNDLTSAMTLYKEAHRLMNKGVIVNGKKVPIKMFEIQQIFNKSSQMKKHLYYIKNPDMVADGYAVPFKTADNVASAWRDYRAGLAPGLQKFADYSAISTLFKPRQKPKVAYNHPDMKQWNRDSLWANHTHQSEFMKEATPQHVKDFFDMYNYISSIPDRVPDRIITDPDGKERPAMESHMRKLIEDATTGKMAFQFPYDYYDVPAPKRVDMRIASLKEKAESKWDASQSDAMTNEDSPLFNTLDAKKARIFKEMGTFIDEGGDFKLNGEEQMLFTELRDLFSRHPQISEQFDMVFKGELAVTRRDGRAKDFENATLDDLRKFVASVRGTFHGDLMSKPTIKSEIPKWMYWMVPDKYHRQYSTLDLKLDETVVRTIDGKDEKALVISSPAKRLVNMSNTMQLATEIQSAKLTEQMIKQLEDLHTDLGKDFDTIWRYAVMDRVVTKGKPSQYVKKAHSQYKKQIESMADTIYRINGKDVSIGEAVQMVSKRITKANELVWKTVHNPDQVNYFYDKSKKWVNSGAVLSRIKESIIAGDYNNLYVPDTWTLNNMVIQDYVHNMMIKQFGDEVPRKGSEIWIKEANKFIDNAGMQANLDIPQLPFDSYYPHRNHSNKALTQWRINEKNRKNMHTADMLRNQEYASMRLYEDAGLLNTLGDDALLSDVLGLTDGIPQPKDLNVGQQRIPGHLRKRSEAKDQIPDWDPGIRSYFEYINEMVKSNHNKALALVGASEINAMEAKLKSTYQEKSKHYADFLRMYLSDQVMNQTMVPTSWKDNYAALNLKESGYYYFTDRYYTELDTKISKTLGTDPLLQENNITRPLRLAEIANLEAKYSLITLLSRPKTGIMNMYGGATILASDVGLSSMMKGWQLKHITNINPDIKTWDDAVRFAENNGAMESLVRNEVMNSQAWGNKKNRRGLNEMMEAIKQDPSVSDLKLTEIAKRHGLSDNIMNLAALPMRYSERILRSRSFFAHYIKAIEVLEVTGPSAANHPWALKMAQRGVATSQFMYNNANRPAFARSNVGKIFSRFKLWGINSVKFRADAFNELAGDLKYNVQDPATAKRFNNIMMVDMFMIALAGLFPFSVFGSSVPEPFSWMNELVKWAFGDEKDKENAFRKGGGLPIALAPLAVALPPSSRMLTTWIDPVMTGDWGDVTGYTAWTLFPFGLLARDGRNALRNPAKGIDRLTGIPVGEVLQPSYYE